MRKGKKMHPHQPVFIVGGQAVYGLSEKQIAAFFVGMQVTIRNRSRFMLRFDPVKELKLKEREREQEERSVEQGRRMREWRKKRALPVAA